VGDWEAVFGRRLDLAQANALLARVHRKGFGCAKIENEGGTHEISVYRLSTEAAAERIVRKAHRRGFRRAYVAHS
jgi:SPOR domain